MSKEKKSYGEACLVLYHYLTSILLYFAGPDKFKVSDRLINANFLSLLERLNEIKEDKKFDIKYNREGIGETLESYVKSSPTMTIGPYNIVVVKKEGEKTLIVRHGIYEPCSIPIKEMLKIEPDKKISSEPMKFKLPERKPPVDEFSEFLQASDGINHIYI